MEAGEIVEQGGKKYLVLGKTFGTKTNLAAGDRFVLEGETLNLERDDEGKVIKASVWVPEVIEATDKGAESLETIVKRAKEHGVLQEKVRHDGGGVEYLPTDAGKPNTASKEFEGAAIMLFLPTEQAKKLAALVDVNGAKPTKPKDMHLTLVFLGKAKDLEEKRPLIEAVLEQFAKTTQPISGKIGGAGRFLKVEEDGTNAVYASFDSPGLSALREKLASSLADIGVEPGSDHDFTPHITLAYAPTDAWELPKVEPIEVEFDSVVLGWGDERKAFQLSGSEGKKASKETYPDESKKLRFVAQSHYRGRSCHLDLRFEYKRGGDNYLRGWTVAHQVAGAIKAPVTTMGEAKKADANPGNWKMDLKTGLIKPRQIRGGTVRRGDLRAFQKAAEIPADWLNVEGVTEEQDPSEKPPAGATQQFPGVFTILDKGQVEWGAQKPWFSEFFLEGKWEGRWCFRLVKREGEKWFTPTCQDDFDKFFDAKGWITLKDGRRVYSKGPDKGSLNSNRSGSYTGIVYRAVGAEGKVKTALGPATYFSPRQSAAENYGKDVREYHIELDKVLGTNSREYDHVKNVAQNRWTGDKPLAHVINEVAREMKYDAIYAGPTFGLAVFERGRGYEVGPASSEKTNSDKAKILPPGKEEEETRTGSYWVLMQPESQLPYVLSKEATSEGWLPPKGVSCLPAKMRKSVPKELQFWTMDRKEALGARSRLAEFEELGGTELKGSKLLILRELTEDA